jgi:uncharacterized coiled-coil protein SlyX
MLVTRTRRSRTSAEPPCGVGSERRGDDSRLPRSHTMQPQLALAAFASVGLALLAPSCAAAAESEDVAELKRMVRELQAQNRQLSQRLGALENSRAAARTKPRAQERPSPAPTVAQASTAAPSTQDVPILPTPRDTTGMGLEDRVRELEIGQAAQEQATRQIIQDTLLKTGPKINQFVALSGAIEVVAARSQEFAGPTTDILELGTVELDFDITLSEWVAASLVLGFESGSNPIFPVTTTPVDRFTLDRTNIRIGNFEQFPIALRLGREILPFGTSTGVARADTLSIGTPLTTEVFESRQTAVGLEFAFPTPSLQPPAPAVVVPRSEPQFIAPLVSNFMRRLGYRPLPQRVDPPVPVTPPLDPPPFYGSFMVYKGSENIGNRTKIEDFNASVGYRTRGHCGKPYEELRSSLVCPWQLDVHVDYNTSVFDSRFLVENYQPFLSQIGRIPGIAASAKASFGPFALVAEVNRAMEEARFVDDRTDIGTGIARSITPMTWQLSLAYQFDWNPWITEIGAQGSFISVGYSGSKDMAGVAGLNGGDRIGFVPQHRLLITGGEWVMDGLKVAVEYSANWDYPIASGGTGQLAHGILGSVELNF